MTTAAVPIISSPQTHRSETLWSRALGSGRVLFGGGTLVFVMVICLVTSVLTLRSGSAWNYNDMRLDRKELPPDRTALGVFGYDKLGRSIFSRCLLGGVISLSIGVSAAAISVVLGVAVGLLAGYRGGWIDAALMRCVDILYGLPYILLVILFRIGMEDRLSKALGSTQVANFTVLFLAIGMVSWLTLARVVRGQVMSLRGMPFIEACQALGMKQGRIFLHHILPNLVGPVMVYATLTVPGAILQESFLSFLGVGVQPPLPTWGSLAKDGVDALSPVKVYWWMLLFPCLLLMITLLALNFLGDGLRDIFDPKRDAGKL